MNAAAECAVPWPLSCAPGRRGQRRVGDRGVCPQSHGPHRHPVTTVFSHDSKKNKNIFHYDFSFLVFLFMLSSFKMLGFECSQSPWGKLTSCTFDSRNHFAATNIITRLTNQAFQVQFALKKFDVILFISRISSIVYGT